MNKFFVLFLLVTMVSVYASETLPTYISAINDGRLSEAKQLLLNAIENEGTSILDKAIAYKHLGTVQFRLGEEDFRQAFETSEKWFQEALSVATDIKPVQQEYSILLFQRANCFISACENELAKSKLQGIVPIPFKLIKDYISPAEADLQKAKSDYPVSQKEDLLLLSLELQLAKFHIWTLTEQAEMAEKAGQEALTLAETALGETFLAPDIHAKLLLRYATALVEVKGQGKENLKKALELLAEGMEKPCGNVEINSALISLWGKLLLMSDASEADLKNAEERLLAATETLEQLRASNVDSMDFMARKAYFSSRTSLYETLVELHARQNKPFEMLKAINRMRSRSIQDYVNNQTGKDEPTTEEQLCQILREGDGMLVAYFIATDTVWIITYTEAGGKISHTMRSGQEIVYLATQTLNVFSSVQHLQGYFRFGSSYRLVPEAILAANILYKELFATAHEEFTKRKLVHLYVLPHNILNYFPFGALVVLVNDSNALASMYVADTGLSITYLPSLSAIMDSGKISLTSNDTMVLARGTYSYPAYYKNNPANPDDPAAQPLNLSNVPSEGQFVSQILQTKPQNCFKEQNASEYNLMTQASVEPKSIVHIASHAHLNHISPLDSYVVLAAGNNEDGKVKVRELLTRYQGKIQAGLLVLSACDTNRGESNIQPGDDIAALSNAFLVAGVDNVIATQWPASDSSFPKIMALFYEGVQHALPLDEALSKAQQQFLMDNQSAMRYPIFWANIVLIGKNQKK